jgi:hypothetical protein
MRPFERVYTVVGYYDGPRRGVADFNGAAHLYESEWSDIADDYTDFFNLSPVDPETFQLVQEHWQIWLRWERARHEGTVAQDTHPALPEDRARHEELEALLRPQLVTAAQPVRASATFRRDRTRPWDGKGHSPPLEVQWVPFTKEEGEGAEDAGA